MTTEYVTEIWWPPADDGRQALHSHMPEPEPLPEPEPEGGVLMDTALEEARLAYLDAEADRNEATPGTVGVTEKAAAVAWDAYQDLLAEKELELEPRFDTPQAQAEAEAEPEAGI